MRSAWVLAALLAFVPPVVAEGDCSAYDGPDDAVSERLPQTVRSYDIHRYCYADGTQSESITVYGLGAGSNVHIRTTHSSEGDESSVSYDNYYTPVSHDSVVWSDGACRAHAQVYNIEEELECAPLPVAIFGRWDAYPAEAREIVLLLP